MYAQVDRIGQGVPETQEQASTTETQGSPSTGLPAHPSTPPPAPAPRSGFLRQIADHVVSSTTTS